MYFNKKFLKKISLNKLNVAKLSTGTIIGQLITLLSLPFLTRIYGVETFGIWALVMAISMIMTSFTDLGMSYSMMEDKESTISDNYKVISTISVFLTFFLSGLLALLLVIFPNLILELSPILFFLILSAYSFFSQQIQICYTWLNRTGEYGVLMKNPIVNAIVTNSFALILGSLGYIQYGYFIGYLMGQLVTLINMKKQLPKGLLIFDYRKILLVINKNKKYISFQMPTNFLNNVKSQTMVLMINVFFGTQMLGYYSLTMRILQMPLTLLAKSIGRVFFKTVSDMKRRNEELGNYVFVNLVRGMKLSILPIALLMGLGDELTVLIFGEKWRVTGELVQILSLQYFFMFLQSTMQGLSIVLNKQKNAMIVSFVHILSLVISVLIGSFFFDSIYIALTISTILFILIQQVYFYTLFKEMDCLNKNYQVSMFKSTVMIGILAVVFKEVIIIINI